MSNDKQRRALLMAGLLAVMALAAGGCDVAGSNGATLTPSSTAVPSASVQQSLAAYKGKVVILDFWATWCPPCIQEIPGFIQLQNKYKDQGLEIIGVSIDPISGRGTNASSVNSFMKKYGINYAIWVVDNPAALGSYDVSQGIPTTYIIDREGKIKDKHVGARPMSVFENGIKPLL